MGALIPTAGSNGLTVYEAPDNPWAEAAASVDTGAYLKFNGNTGEYTYGADDNALGYGSQVVADLFNVGFGWICWKDSDPVEEVLVKILDGKPPLEHNLTDHGPYDSDDDGWREACSMPMVLLTNVVEDQDDDSEAGTKLMFKGSSASTVRATRKLSGAFGKLFREHQGEFPVVEVSAEQFAAREKKYGKKYAPIFTIKGWLSEDELAALVGDTTGGDYEPEVEPKAAAPAARRLAPPKQAETPVEEPEIEAEEEAAPAPAPRRAAAAEAAPRARRTPVQSQGDDLPAPEPRGRSEARRQPAPQAAAEPAEQPAANRRVRRF